MEARITPEATHGVTSSPGFPTASPGLVLSPGAHHHLSPGGRSPTVHQGTTAGWDHDRPEGRNRETPPHSCPLRSQPLQPPQPAALRSPQMQTHASLRVKDLVSFVFLKKPHWFIFRHCRKFTK